MDKLKDKHIKEFNNEDIIEEYNNSSLLAKLSSICMNKKFIMILLFHFITVILYKLYNKYIKGSVHYNTINSFIKYITSLMDAFL